MRSLATRKYELALGADRSLFLLPAIALVLGVLALLLLVETGYVISVGYEIQRLERNKRDWQRTNQLLEVEVARSSSLPHIEYEARERLEMTRPGSYLYVTLDQTKLRPGRDPQGSADTNSSDGKDFKLLRSLLRFLGREG